MVIWLRRQGRRREHRELPDPRPHRGRDANGWHSEILVPFGKDLGTKTYPMYAAYLYFAGDTYEGVWNEDIQSIVSSLSVSSH